MFWVKQCPSNTICQDSSSAIAANNELKGLVNYYIYMSDYNIASYTHIVAPVVISRLDFASHGVEVVV